MTVRLHLTFRAFDLFTRYFGPPMVKKSDDWLREKLDLPPANMSWADQEKMDAERKKKEKTTGNPKKAKKI